MGGRERGGGGERRQWVYTQHGCVHDISKSAKLKIL